MPMPRISGARSKPQPAPLYEKMGQDASNYGYAQAGANQNFYRDIVASFYKALSGAPAVGLQGMGTSATNATEINKANTAAAQEFIGNAQKTSVTSGTGAGIACWIAARLYGRTSLNFYLARYWLMQVWQGRLANLTRRLYVRYGERLSHHPWAVKLLKPFFDRAVTQGRRAIYHGQ